MINPQKKVLNILLEAVKDEPALELFEITDDINMCGYVDLENGYERVYYYNDTPETIKERILIDFEIDFIDKSKFSTFLANHLDSNSLMVMDHLVITNDSEIDESTYPPSDIRKHLYGETGDEYSLYAGLEEESLGYCWIERQIPFINLKNIAFYTCDLCNGYPDSDRTNIFLMGVLQTLFHECRHLFYECNEIIPIGEGTKYPETGGEEDEVEAYCIEQADKYISDFVDCLDFGKMNEYLSKMNEYLSKIALIRELQNKDIEIEER